MTTNMASIVSKVCWTSPCQEQLAKKYLKTSNAKLDWSWCNRSPDVSPCKAGLCCRYIDIIKVKNDYHGIRGGQGFESRWSLIFIRLLISNCLNWKIYCDDHSSLSSTTAVHIWIISFLLHAIDIIIISYGSTSSYLFLQDFANLLSNRAVVYLNVDVAVKGIAGNVEHYLCLVPGMLMWNYSLSRILVLRSVRSLAF